MGILSAVPVAADRGQQSLTNVLHSKSISMSTKGGLSKGVGGWTEVWSHVSVSVSLSGSAGNTTTFRPSISFKKYTNVNPCPSSPT